MAKKKPSAAKKARFGSYQSGQNWKKNRISNLKSHLEKHPDDAIAQSALTKTQNATKPRRAGYKTKNVFKTADRMIMQIEAMLRRAAKAASYEDKKNAKARQEALARLNKETRDAKNASRKPRHKAKAK